MSDIAFESPAHLRIAKALSTPLGSRVGRRGYGTRAINALHGKSASPDIRALYKAHIADAFYRAENQLSDVTLEEITINGADVYITYKFGGESVETKIT